MTRDRDDQDNRELIRKVEQFSREGSIMKMKNQPQEAIEAYRNAYHCVMSIGQEGYMQRACAFNLGAALISSRNYPEGLRYLKQAKPPEGQQDGKSNGDLYYNFGLAYKGLQNITKCKYYLKKALEEYRKEENNVRMECITIHLLQQLLSEKGLYQEAEFWLKHLIDIYTKYELKEELLTAKVERARILLKTEKFALAEDTAEECLQAAKELRLTKSLVNVFNAIALVFSELEKYDKAWDCYKLCESSDLDSVDHHMKALLMHNKGALCNQLHKFEESLNYHKKALESYRELNLRKSQCHTLINLGYAYSQLGQIDEAGDQYLEALQAARECGDKKSEWQCLESLGAVSYNQGSPKQAKEYYKQALGVFLGSTVKGDKNIQDRILGKLTNILKLQLEQPDKSVNQKAAKKTSPEKENKKQINFPIPVEEERTMTPQEQENKQKTDNTALREKKKFLRTKKSLSSHAFQKVARGLSMKSDTKDEEDMHKIKEEVSDIEESDDDTKLKAEMAKILKLSNIENEKDMDSSSTDYVGMNTTDTESESEKELTFRDRTYEEPVPGKRSLPLGKMLLRSGTYDKPSTSTIPPTFKSSAGFKKGQHTSSSDSDSDEKDSRKSRDEKPGTSKRAKISEDEENARHNAAMEEENEALQKKLEEMPLSERDKFLYSQHVAINRKKSEEMRKKQEKEAEQDAQEKSKSCTVM